MARHVLYPQPLTAAAFAPFGQVIEARADASHRTINEGYAERYDDLARLDTSAAGGRPVVSIYRARPRTLPMQVRMVERHRLGSQLFMPLSPQRFLVVVAPAGAEPRAEALQCFQTDAGQGVNLNPDIWHHPLLALDAGGDYLVVERGAHTQDCEVHILDQADIWLEFSPVR
jgi:ureidoglycolate lyase